MLILAGLVMLYFGAEVLIRGSVSLSARLGISKLIVGLTVVAFATSSPELVVGVRSSLTGHGGIVLGNVVGSNICNIALILGCAAIIRRISASQQLLRLEVPIVLGASLLLVYMAHDGNVSRGEGWVLVSLFLAYTAFRIFQGRKADHATDRPPPPERGNVMIDLLMVAAGVGLLAYGADRMVVGAVDIATRMHVSEVIIGLTIMAVGTSLPELAAALVAAKNNEGDIVLGNVIGSNLFNILLVLGTSATLRPIVDAGISLLDLGFMTVLTLALFPIMFNFRSRRQDGAISRWEGIVLLCSYLLYMAYLIIA